MSRMSRMSEYALLSGAVMPAPRTTWLSLVTSARAACVRDVVLRRVVGVLAGREAIRAAAGEEWSGQFRMHPQHSAAQVFAGKSYLRV